MTGQYLINKVNDQKRIQQKHKVNGAVSQMSVNVNFLKAKNWADKLKLSLDKLE